MKKALFISMLAIATATSALALADGGKGGMRAHIDTNGDGKITLAESQAAAKARFDHLDKNKNGVVTQDELNGRGRFMERADANKDGKVTLAEVQTQAQAHFAARDKNKDNVLTADEMGHGEHGDCGKGPKNHPRS